MAKQKFDIQGVGCFCERGHTGGMPSEQKGATTPEIGVFATPSALQNSQKVTGWLIKKFDIQGVGCFCERGHTGGMPSEQKGATTPEIGVFATPSVFGPGV
jgi:hypothetical protein